MIVQVIKWLWRSRLSDKDRLSLLNIVIHRLDIIPLRAIITVDENRRVLVQGKPLDTEQLIVLRESASSTLNSYARNIIREQIRFAAIDQGFLKSDDPQTQLFYKAALWFAQEEQNLLENIASPDPTR